MSFQRHPFYKDLNGKYYTSGTFYDYVTKPLNVSYIRGYELDDISDINFSKDEIIFTVNDPETSDMYSYKTYITKKDSNNHIWKDTALVPFSDDYWKELDIKHMDYLQDCNRGVILTNDNKVYVLGYQTPDYGQLGTYNYSDDYLNPTLNQYWDGSDTVKEVVMLPYGYYILTEEGNLWVGGFASNFVNYTEYYFEDSNETGSTGVQYGTLRKINMTNKFGGNQLIKIWGGGLGIYNINSYNYMFAIDTNNNLYYWGYRGPYGNVLTNSTNIPKVIDKATELPTDMGDIVDMVCLQYSTHILDSNGKVWAWSPNGNYANLGTLGLGFDVKTTNGVWTKLMDLDLYNIVSIHGYKNDGSRVNYQNNQTLYALTDTGNVYGWGFNEYYQLGLNHNDKVWTPTKLNLSNISEIKTYRYNTLFKDTNGDYWFTGKDGHDYTPKLLFASKPIELNDYIVEFPENVDIIKFRFNEDGLCAFLDTDGYIWVWSGYENTLSGLKTDEFSKPNLTPQKIEVFEGGIPVIFKDMECCNNAVHGISIDNDLWSCGENAYYNLGDNSNGDKYLMAKNEWLYIRNIKVDEIQYGGDIYGDNYYVNQNTYSINQSVSIRYGWILKTTDGKLMGWGNWYSSYPYENMYFIGCSSSYTINPIDIGFPEGTIITKYSVGYKHSIALDSNGNVWDWGSDTTPGISGGSYTPVQKTGYAFDNNTFVDVKAGYGYSLLLTDDGRVYVYGKNDHFYIEGFSEDSINETTLKMHFPSGFNVKQIFAGYEWNLMLDERGFVWKFGYNGQHYQAGIGNNKIYIQNDFANRERYYNYNSSLPIITKINDYDTEIPIPQYPINEWYTVTTTDVSQIDLSDALKLSRITIDYDQPEYTQIKCLASFDGRITWRTYDGSSWTEVTDDPLNNIGFIGISIPEMVDALTGMEITTQNSLDFAFGLFTSNERYAPILRNSIKIRLLK